MLCLLQCVSIVFYRVCSVSSASLPIIFSSFMLLHDINRCLVTIQENRTGTKNNKDWPYFDDMDQILSAQEVAKK